MSQRRRGRQSRFAERWLVQGLESLNQLAGFDDDPGDSSLSSSQSAMVSRMLSDYRRWGKPDHSISPARAFATLLGGGTGYADGPSSVQHGTGGNATYRRGAVKLPSVGAAVQDLSSILPEPWRSRLERGTDLLRDPAESKELLDQVNDPCALDPVFRRRGYDLGFLLSDLLDKGMCELGADADVVTGLFCVERKDGLLRLIVDPKISNIICKPPPYTSLPGGASLRDMEVPVGSQCSMSSGDVDCCFFQYRMPVSLRHLFGLPSVKKKFLRPEWRHHERFSHLSDEDVVPLRLTIVPMGWSWSVFLIQLGQPALLEGCEHEATWLINGTRSQLVGNGSDGAIPARALHIDNFACFSTDAALAERYAVDMKNTLAAANVVSTMDDPDAAE